MVPPLSNAIFLFEQCSFLFIWHVIRHKIVILSSTPGVFRILPWRACALLTRSRFPYVFSCLFASANVNAVLVFKILSSLFAATESRKPVRSHSCTKFFSRKLQKLHDRGGNLKDNKISQITRYPIEFVQ